MHSAGHRIHRLHAQQILLHPNYRALVSSHLYVTISATHGQPRYPVQCIRLRSHHARRLHRLRLRRRSRRPKINTWLCIHACRRRYYLACSSAAARRFLNGGSRIHRCFRRRKRSHLGPVFLFIFRTRGSVRIRWRPEMRGRPVMTESPSTGSEVGGSLPSFVLTAFLYIERSCARIIL